MKTVQIDGEKLQDKMNEYGDMLFKLSYLRLRNIQDAEDNVLKAVMALPARYREVIHLFYYDDLSVKEIARVTGRRESTVTSQLTRGRDLLKKALKEDYDFGEIW